MIYEIKKNSISNYPTPVINCTVLCYLTEEDKADENKAVYWIPYQVQLQGCLGMSKDEINQRIITTGEELFHSEQYQAMFQAIELGATLGFGTDLLD